MKHVIEHDFGYMQFRESGFEAGDVIDASLSSWIVANIGHKTNRYPFLIEKSGPNITIDRMGQDGEVGKQRLSEPV